MQPACETKIIKEFVLQFLIGSSYKNAIKIFPRMHFEEISEILHLYRVLPIKALKVGLLSIL